MKPKIIAIVGPTASGKTSVGIKIAKQLNGEIISVDSRQVYRGMDIGTAKDKDFDEWGIDLVDPDEDFSVADFKQYAEEKIDDIISRGKVPVLVGGTGMWLRALIDNFNLTQTPGNPELRRKLEACTKENLFHEYKQLDPDGAEIIDKENKRRLVRALEVTKQTGIPFSKQSLTGEPKYEAVQIGLLVDKEILIKRINDRVGEMIEEGLVDEVKDLKERFGCEIDSMTGIGYRQICRFLDGKDSLEQAIEEIKKATRQYAKRQMTWFKRDNRIQWIKNADEVFKILT